MRRLITAFVTAAIVALGLLPQAGTASAAFEAVEWCAEDPVITVNGTVLTLTTSWPLKALPTVRVVAYVVDVPDDAVVSYAIPGPQVAPATVTFRKGSGDRTVKARVTVKATASFPVIVNATGGVKAASRKGVANQAVHLTIQLPGEVDEQGLGEGD